MISNKPCVKDFNDFRGQKITIRENVLIFLPQIEAKLQ